MRSTEKDKRFNACLFLYITLFLENEYFLLK